MARCRPPPKRAALFDAVLPGEATGVQATDDENGEALKVEDVDETDETGNPDLPNQPEESLGGITDAKKCISDAKKVYSLKKGFGSC